MKQQNKYQLDHTIKPLVFELIKNHKNNQVKEYFKQHPQDIHLKGWMSDTPLHIACGSENFELVKYLIENGADVNAPRTGMYATPLCWAANQEIAAYLLDNEATMNDLELYMATRKDKIQIIDLLLKKGAKINQHDPQYLQCKSKEAIHTYLKHQIDINGCDENESNLLHKLAWLNLPDVFDFAWQSGVPWKKDSSRRTPFVSAKQGKRNLIVHHISKNYPALISTPIKILGTNLTFEKIAFLLKHPAQPSNYIALTQNGRLINYEIKDSNALVINKAIEIDVSIIRNFTIDDSNNLIIPTDDNKLLKIDVSNFHLLETIIFQEENTFDQITYLPKKEIYIGSSTDWKISILNKDFKIIHKSDAADGTFFPIINESENLISFWSYDQSSFFDLYQMEQENEIEFIHSFFEGWNNISKGFAFIGEEMLVAFPKKIEAFRMEGSELINTQTLNIEAYISAYDVCSLAIVSEKLFLFGKGKQLVVYEKSERIEKIEAMQLNLEEEIRQIYFDKEEQKLMVITDVEIKVVDFKNKNWGSYT